MSTTKTLLGKTSDLVELRSHLYQQPKHCSTMQPKQPRGQVPVTKPDPQDERHAPVRPRPPEETLAHRRTSEALREEHALEQRGPPGDHDEPDVKVRESAHS